LEKLQLFAASRALVSQALAGVIMPMLTFWDEVARMDDPGRVRAQDLVTIQTTD